MVPVDQNRMHKPQRYYLKAGRARRANCQMFVTAKARALLTADVSFCKFCLH